MKLRVLVVDDSPFVRRILCNWISSDPDLEVIGQGTNGEEAIYLVLRLEPDVVLLDIEMPKRGGLSALCEILSVRPTPVIMISSEVSQSQRATIRALELGAIDFVLKPTHGDLVLQRESLLEKVRTARLAQIKQNFRAPLRSSVNRNPCNHVVVIGATTAGATALHQLWKAWPVDFPAAILVAQHMPAGFTISLAKSLNAVGTVPCKEAVDGEPMIPGIAYVAPGGLDMTVCADNTISLQDRTESQINSLLNSAAQSYGNKAIGLLLTGYGDDGTKGAVAIRKAGGRVFGESEETCVVYGLSKNAKLCDGLDAEFPLYSLASAVIACLNAKSISAA